MGALTLTRKDYQEGIQKVAEAASDKSYLDQFTVTFPDGLNTADTLEICRAIQSADMDAKIRLMRICIRGRNVEVTCPNGDKERFCMAELTDNFSAFPLFVKEPLALMALSDCVYGYILKKYVRLSKSQGAGEKAE